MSPPAQVKFFSLRRNSGARLVFRVKKLRSDSEMIINSRENRDQMAKEEKLQHTGPGTADDVCVPLECKYWTRISTENLGTTLGERVCLSKVQES